MFEGFSPKKKIEQAKDTIGRYAKIATLAALSLLPMKAKQVGTDQSFLSKGYDKDRQEQVFKEFQEKFHTFYDNAESVTLLEIISEKMAEVERLERDLYEKTALQGIIELTPETEGISNTIDARLQEVDSLRNVLTTVFTPEEVKEAFRQRETEFKDAYNRYDEQARWMERVISSETYRMRLVKEIMATVPGTPEFIAKMVAKEIQASRLEKLKDKDYVLKLGNSLYEVPEGSVLGEYDLIDREVRLTHNPGERSKNVGVHEFAHDITHGESGVTEHAKNLYNKSFNKEGVYEEEPHVHYGVRNTPENDEYVHYHESPTERDARKKVLEYEMEHLGIKNYDEEFTDDHYRILLGLVGTGKLTYNSEEFIRMTKQEYMKQIMNTIAEGPQEESQDVSA